MGIPTLSRRRVAMFGFAGVLAYVLWIARPYLESIVVRDAAVTSWISVTAAPIAGYTTNPLYPGARVGADGRIATITDNRADQKDLAAARAQELRSIARVAAEQALVDGMRRALQTRSVHATGFATTFGNDLSASITGSRSGLDALRLRLTLARADEQRVRKLTEGGLMSQTQLDAARGTVAELDRQIADVSAALARADARHHAARRGVFLLEDGTDGNSAFQNLADARLRLTQAEADLTELRAEADASRLVLDASQLAYNKARSLDISVPPGAMVWNLISSPGAPVQPGSPVASWVDCRVMLVDVPVSDVETSLLHPGSLADVVLEGERKERHGTVMLTRGSAGTLGTNDLAALAKGRHTGIGQAIVKITPDAADVRKCAVGHAAYVDFPEVGLFDLFRARMRW